jgi:hypothetical protein
MIIKKSIFIVTLIGTSSLYAQDYVAVCKTLNYPPLFKLIAFGNCLNQNIRTVEDYRILRKRNNCDYDLQITRGFKTHLVILDTADNFISENEKYATNSIDVFYDSLDRIVRTVDHENYIDEYLYNEESKLVKIQSYYASSDRIILINSGSKKNCWIGRYDDFGRLIEEITYKPKKPEWRSFYTWEEGNIVSSEDFNQWNKKGRYMKEIYIYEDGVLSSIEGYNEKNRKKYTISYNWIQKTAI